MGKETEIFTRAKGLMDGNPELDGDLAYRLARHQIEAEQAQLVLGRGGAGGPAVSLTREQKTRVVPIRMTPKQHEELRAKALAVGLSMQKIMETLAESYLCDKIKISISAR